MDFSPVNSYTGQRGNHGRQTAITVAVKRPQPPNCNQTNEGGATMTEQEKVTTPTIDSAGTAAMPPIANMDETDWTAMLMEMRILSA